MPTPINDVREQSQQLLRSFSDRIRDNVLVALFGLRCLRDFARQHGIDIAETETEPLADLCREELCGEVDGGKLAVDILLEKLAYMAESNILVRDRDYRVVAKEIYLRLEPCLEKFQEWARKVRFANEILDGKAYRQMLNERKQVVM